MYGNYYQRQIQTYLKIHAIVTYPCCEPLKYAVITCMKPSIYLLVNNAQHYPLNLALAIVHIQ